MATKLAKIVADFTTSLATKLAAGASTCSLQSITDDDGETLDNGTYFFTIDGDNAQKEHIVATLTGTSLSAIKSVSRKGVQTSNAVREHRIGASVTITNFAHIKYLNDLLDGTTDLNASDPLAYDADPDLTGNNKKLATVKLVEDTAIAGGADASTTVKGISKLSVAPASATEPIAVGDNDNRVSPVDLSSLDADKVAALAGTSGTPSATNKYVTNDDTATSGANKVLRLDGSGYLPALNANQLTNLPESPYLGFNNAGTHFRYPITLASGDAWTISGATVAWRNSHASAAMTAGQYAMTYLLGHGTDATYQFDSGKDITIEFMAAFSGMGAGENATIGLGVNSFLVEAYTGVSDGLGFTAYSSSNGLFARSGNGTSQTRTEITGITVANWNKYKIVYTFGTDAKFYVNDVLKATIITNHPDIADSGLFGVGTDNTCTVIFSQPIMTQEL